MTLRLLKQIYGVVPRLIKGLFQYHHAIAQANRELKRRAPELLAATHELPYEIPAYEAGMPYCQSGEKYLRPTYLCESRAPQIIAMANKLGAFQKSNREYVEVCYNFVKENIDLSIYQKPSGAVKTLLCGRALCLDSTGLFIALCRTAGIPARYKLFSHIMEETAYEVFTTDNSLVKKWSDAVGHWMLHISAEILIDGQWLVAELDTPSALAAGIGRPICNLGDDPVHDPYFKMPDSEVRYEGIPRHIVMATSLGLKLFGGLLMGVEMRIRERTGEGKKILKEVGVEGYNRRARQTYNKAAFPEVSRKLAKALKLVQK